MEKENVETETIKPACILRDDRLLETEKGPNVKNVFAYNRIFY